MKGIFKIALATSLAILIYEGVNLLLLYKYIKFDEYAAGIAVVALATGIGITKRYHVKPGTNVSAYDINFSLTNKELRILQQISEGKSNKEIAALNFVELSTIKTHINNLYAKLGVNNRKQAVEAYQQYLINTKSTLSPPLGV
jgi:DNA-binding CsgD family transcriptional regulator